jgi:hypothetical protein
MTSTKKNVRTVRWSLILPFVFVLMTTVLLSFPFPNRCGERALSSDACLSLPTLLASLINGPAPVLNDSLPFRIVGGFLFWLWTGWFFEARRDREQGRVVRTRWVRLITYVPWLAVSAIRSYMTLSHDRLSLTFVVTVFQQFGLAAVLEGAGKIWVERLQLGWFLVLLASFASEMLGTMRQPSPAAS